MKGLQFNETFRLPSDFWSVSLEEKQLQTMSLLIPQVLPRLQESQILQNSSKNLPAKEECFTGNFVNADLSDPSVSSKQSDKMYFV